MKSVLRATAILSSGSVVRVGVGVVANKIWAVLIGPIGIGYLGVMQGVVGIASVIAGVGVGTGVVRLGAQAISRGETEESMALKRAALLITWCAGLAMLTLFTLFRAPLSRWIFDSSDQALSLPVLGAAVCLMAVSATHTGILNAHHDVKSLTQSAIYGVIAGSILSVALIWYLRVEGVVWAVLGLSAGLYVFTRHYASRYVSLAGVKRSELAQSMRRLFSFGIPYVGSTLMGTGVILALPLLVNELLGLEGVGYYRAALTISVGYLGILTTALAQDYYPRISAVSDDPNEVALLLNQQLRLTLLIGGPIIVCAVATAPLTVPLIYSSEFAPTVGLLSWQLIGSLFKFWAWTFAFVILARSPSSLYFIVETVVGVALVGATWYGIEWLGLIGAGVGYSAAYLIYALVVWGAAQRAGRIRVWLSNFGLMVSSLAASGGCYYLIAMEAGIWSVVVSALIATGFSGWCGYVLLSEYRNG